MTNSTVEDRAFDALTNLIGVAAFALAYAHSVEWIAAHDIPGAAKFITAACLDALGLICLRELVKAEHWGLRVGYLLGCLVTLLLTLVAQYEEGSNRIGAGPVLGAMPVLVFAFLSIMREVKRHTRARSTSARSSTSSTVPSMLGSTPPSTPPSTGEHALALVEPAGQDPSKHAIEHAPEGATEHAGEQPIEHPASMLDQAAEGARPSTAEQALPSRRAAAASIPKSARSSTTASADGVPRKVLCDCSLTTCPGLVGVSTRTAHRRRAGSSQEPS